MGGELGALTSNPHLQDMIEDNIPTPLEVQARTPLGPISVSACWVLPVHTRSKARAVNSGVVDSMEESSSSSSSSSSGGNSSEDSNSDVAEDLPPTPLLDTPLSLENL